MATDQQIEREAWRRRHVNNGAATSWLDRAVSYLSPGRGLRRTRARIASDLLVRHYEAAATGRRTQGWRRTAGDANAVMATSLARLRENARDLVRNNAHATRAVGTIANQVVGWGIVAKTRNKRAEQAWKDWSGTRACDAEGRHDFAGLQKLAMRGIVESGEVLIRRRWRLPIDGLPLPFQLQLLEPDYIDTSRTEAKLPNGGRIVQGIEYDPVGRRAAYWLFPEHPGAAVSTFGSAGGGSRRFSAEDILHVFHQERIGQVRAVSWFAPVILKMKDYDEYDDATLMKQKIAACLAVITSDMDGTVPALGTGDDTQNPGIDSIEPGAIINAPPGRTITVIDPPSVRDYADYSKVSLQTIAAGLGVTYEDLTGDYTDLPFSAARMSRLAHQSRIEDWRWRTMIPQLCDPVWGWAMEAAAVMGIVGEDPGAAWTADAPAAIDPSAEALAFQREVRGGSKSWSEAVRERGYDPDEVLKEIAADNKKFDQFKIILDSDPRTTTQAGLPRDATASAAPSPAPQEPAA